MIAKIITIHALQNPGSVFQAFALHKYLASIGVESVIIDYRPSYLYTEGAKSKLSIIKYLVKRFFYYKVYQSRKHKFESFIQMNMVLTRRFYTSAELESSKIEADVFIVGSDQLWNTDYRCGSDMAFYLNFVKKGLKVSYATSVGKASIDDKNLSILKTNLTGFNSLSVREKSTSEKLTRLLNRDINWVCDPVFLLPSTTYRKLFPKTQAEKSYAVIYLSDANPILDEIVNYYKEAGLKIILMGGFSKRCYCDVHIKDAGPLDFLSLIDRAEIVVSTSFHATAFSHIFHKKFITIIPDKNGERILSLLRLSNLEYRGIKETNIDFELIDKEIEWDIVDKKLAPHISMSQEYLNNIFENA